MFLKQDLQDAAPGIVTEPKKEEKTVQVIVRNRRERRALLAQVKRAQAKIAARRARG